MFETDDFDQILSQFEFPDAVKDHIDEQPKNHDSSTTSHISQSITNPVPKSNFSEKKNDDIISKQNKPTDVNNVTPKPDHIISPKHTKRKILNSLFDQNSKRKFPGPAGLLTGSLDENNDVNICHMELLSQDVDFTQNHLRKDIFDSPLWCRLLVDIKDWNLHNVDTIKDIKQQALSGNVRRRKAQTVIAFIEAIDRSATDPLIILRDTTGSIKCTLHRDAWSSFSAYIVSQYCALVLWKPTILTTGSAFKKHYLNITLSNIFAIYSSAVLKDDNTKILPNEYAIVREDDFTVIKAETLPHNLDITSNNELVGDSSNLLDGLDSIFSDDLF